MGFRGLEMAREDPRWGFMGVGGVWVLGWVDRGELGALRVMGGTAVCIWEGRGGNCVRGHLRWDLGLGLRAE